MSSNHLLSRAAAAIVTSFSKDRRSAAAVSSLFSLSASCRKTSQHHTTMRRSPFLLALGCWLSSSSSSSSTAVRGLPIRNTRGGAAGTTTADEQEEVEEQEQDAEAVVVEIMADNNSFPTHETSIQQIQRKQQQATSSGGTRSHPVLPSGSAGTAGGAQQQQQRRHALLEEFYQQPHDESLSQQLQQVISEYAYAINDFLVDTRRTLHKHPELMYQEQFTSKTIQTVLRDIIGITNYTTGWAKNIHPHAFPGPGGYGVVVDIGTGQEPCMLLRADMDALPILELTEHVDEFRSQTPHQFHACGHDSHTSMLLGAAYILHKHFRDSLPGTVRLMFQPAEEGGAGAKRMREEGVLRNYPQPQWAFGMHVWPTLPTGTVAASPGPWMAACDRFEILIHGVGGHAAMPHLTIDPIVTASSIVMNLQTIISRNVSPLEAGVVSITQFDAGTEVYNVIPHSATLKGTIRALSTDRLLELKDRVQHIVESTADMHHCNTTITFSPEYYPVTVNDPELLETFSLNVARQLFSPNNVKTDLKTMGAEDFAFVAESIPSTFFFLGQGGNDNDADDDNNVKKNRRLRTDYGLHHPHFALDESVLPKGVELHVNLAIRALAQLQRRQQNQSDLNDSTAASAK